MIRRPPRSTRVRSSAASDVYKRQGKNNIIAEIEDTYSFTTDTSDFWRREGQQYPKHGGRFTGEPGYFKHVLAGARGLLEKTQCTPVSYTHLVFHQPNGKFPRTVAS